MSANTSVSSQPDLPTPLTPLVGRSAVLTTLHDLVYQPVVRLVTLTGPGGVGKTRLALAVAHTIANQGGRVSFIGLATLSDPSLVIQAIAQALGVAEAGNVEVFDRVVAALRDQDVLLVLDNLEHLIDAASRLADLLRRCPRLTLLVTSRQALHLSGEQEVPVLPLVVPDLATDVSVDRIADSEAVMLFVERARGIRPDFALTRDNAAAVAAICARLDGLPLAIELAAARIRLLPVHGLLARLDHRLALLTGGARDLPSRQQTLRSTIAWSYDLLDPTEQRLFRRLSVFAGGWTFEAATAVVLDADHTDLALIDGLTALLERSLLVQGRDPDGTPRYQMLATIGEFASEELDRSGEAEAMRHRYGLWGVQLAERAYNRVLGPESRQVVATLESEYDNLRAIFAWSIATGQVEISHVLIAALGQFWYLRGYLSEGVQWCAHARSLGDEVPPLLRAKADGMDAFLRWAQGNYAQAAELLDHVIATPELAAEPSFLANMLIVRGVVAEDQGDFARAEQLHTDAAALFRDTEEPVFVGYALTGLGVAAYHRGDADRADMLFTEALALERAAGNAYGIGLVLINLARLARDRGDYSTAAAYYRDSLRLRMEHGGLIGVAGCLRGLASVAVAREAWERASRLYAAAEALAHAVGAPVPPAAQERHAQVLATLRAALGEDHFAVMWSDGQALTLEHAVAFALADEAVPSPASDVARPVSSRPAMSSGLTAREVEVLRRIVEGETDREIALALSIGTRTVSSHVTSILTKLNVSSRAAAAAWAVRQGIA